MTILSVYFLMKDYQCPYLWHGGSPDFKGSCWCGNDKYCMCTPSLAIEVIIETFQNNDFKIVVIKRRDPPHGFALPGGFVNIGESTEDAAVREIREETNLKLNIEKVEQFHVYSHPSRDKRRHTASSVFRYVFHDPLDMSTTLKKGDDAKSVMLVSLRDILKLDLLFDHSKIMKDYIEHYHPTLQY
jgi:8-oxo-dGTP diphosphatase